MLSFYTNVYLKSNDYYQSLIPILNQSAIFVGPDASGLSASSTYVQYALSPPPSRLNIIFDLEMVLRKKCLLSAKA
jgi:hypothetical protein